MKIENLTDSDRVAINKLIAEAVGVEVELKPMCGVYPCTPESPCNTCDEVARIYPDFCGSDVQALRALKAFTKQTPWLITILLDYDAARVVLTLPTDGLAQPIPIQFTSEVHRSSQPIAAALADAMMEKYQVVLTGDGIEGENYMSWRLKSIIETSCKERKNESET